MGQSKEKPSREPTSLYIYSNFTNWNTITMGYRGCIFITNPAVVADAKSFDVNHSPTNSGTVIADTRTLDSPLSRVQNSGTLIVRRNLNFNNSTLDQRPNGHLIAEAGCTTSLGQLRRRDGQA